MVNVIGTTTRLDHSKGQNTRVIEKAITNPESTLSSEKDSPAYLRILYLVVPHNMSDKTVLVTGASGFIASHVVQQLLETGHQVHATVQSTKNEKKIKHLLDMQTRWPGQLKLSESDLLVAGSFDAAMEGCLVVYHLASPFLIESKIRNDGAVAWLESKVAQLEPGYRV
ncbi:hypothetical protein BDV23DRAFT_187592 [Aspergillus alliaceus]|uniref:NAD-dependent epimerase/dehydratase domain-containing protein n=1 Tax=Petromyces alliaceus TaxID=209559 RepID=A0A5N7BWB5_PETAA|nr:hypothetical protein BDV23DRAFT_187592 [Aspergillus alliaceus]